MEVSGHEEGEIAIPINMSSSGGGGTYDHDHDGNSASQHHSHMMMMGWEEKKEKEKVRYRECLKNHAAAMGGNARDGCGEFMPSGEEGTMEALNCSACHCHRNFHRRDDMHMLLHPFHYPLISSSSPHPHPHLYDNGRSRKWAQQKPSMVAEKKNKRKRFRTKFTEEQKEKMLGFAEKVGWKIQKQEEAVVHHFCQDIGVKRRVLKVWMHNNKHNHRRPTPTHNNNNPPPPPTA